VETQRVLVALFNLWFDNYTRARSQWSETVWAVVADLEVTSGRQAMRTRDSIRSSYVSFRTRAFEIYATLPAVQGRYLPDVRGPSG